MTGWGSSAGRRRRRRGVTGCGSGGLDERKEGFKGWVEVEAFRWSGGEGSFCVMRRDKVGSLSFSISLYYNWCYAYGSVTRRSRWTYLSDSLNSFLFWLLGEPNFMAQGLEGDYPGAQRRAPCSQEALSVLVSIYVEDRYFGSQRMDNVYILLRFFSIWNTFYALLYSPFIYNLQTFLFSQ